MDRPMVSEQENGMKCECCDETEFHGCDGCDCCQECCNCTPTDCDCDACIERREAGA